MVWMEKNIQSRVKGVSRAEWGWEFTVLNSVDRGDLRTGKI